MTTKTEQEWQWLVKPKGTAHDISFTWADVSAGLPRQKVFLRTLSDLDLDATHTKTWKDTVQNILRPHDPLTPIIREEKQRRLNLKLSIVQ